MTNVLPKDGEVLYFPNFYTEEQSNHFMKVLTDKIKWQQDKIKMYGKEHNLPRLTSWYTDDGQPYTFSGIKMLSNKIDLEELVLLKLAACLESGVIFNSVLLNYYRDGKDSVAWHQDNEPELGPNPVIASITFGETRTFKFRHLIDKQVVDLPLTNGSLVIMKGDTQNKWQHSIPKTSKNIGPRINLTFRLMS